MSVKTPTVQEWINPLRNFTLGVSIASLILAPSAGYPADQTEQRTLQGNIGLMSTIPDGIFDLRTVRIPTLHGLDFLTLAMPASVANNNVEKDSIPLALRDMTGLSIETLASLVNVSRNAYYKWLDGKGVSEEHEARLTELFNTCCTLHDLLRSNLKEFLEATGPAGRPIDLLAHGDSSAVIGLALRSPSDPTYSSNESHLVRRTSGLSGWLRPAVKLSWGAPHLTEVEREEALYRLGSRPRSTEVEPHGKLDEDNEAFDLATKQKFARWVAHRFDRSAFPEDIVGAVVKPILENLSQMQLENDPDLDALRVVKEVRLAKIEGSPPFDVRILFIIPESGLPDNGIALDRFVARMRRWFNPLAARLVAWDARHIYEITVGDYLDTQQIYLDHYTYRGQTIQGLLPSPRI